MDNLNFGSYLLVDSSATNAIAYDYALSIIDENGREGAFSQSVLGVALESPKDVYRCRPANVELTPCPNPTCVAGLDSCQTWAYHWRPSTTPAYQPYTASPLDAPQGYLKGYRAYEYYYLSNTHNYLRWNSSDTNAMELDYGLTWGRDVDYRINGSTAGNPGGGNACHVFTAVYKVFVNGTWQTMESGWSNNFDAAANPLDRCPNMYSALPWCSLPICETQTFIPPKPQNVTAAPGPGPNQITVSWTPPTSGTEVYPDLAGYYLYVNDPMWSFGGLIGSNRSSTKPVSALFRSDHPLIRLDSAVTSITLNGMKPCRTYTFYLAAISGAGRLSEPSLPSGQATAYGASPYKPGAVRPRLWTTNDSYFVHLDSPTASTEVARLIGDFACEAGTELKQSTDLTNWTTITANPPYAYGPSTAMYEWKITPTPGIPQYFRLSRTLSGADIVGDTTVIEVLPHDNPPLSAPTHLDALNFSTDGTNHLRWCPNPDAEGITGYRIFRAPTSGGPYVQVSPQTDLSATTFQWIDTGATLQPFTPATNRYYYVIAAVKGAQISAYSPENGAGESNLNGFFDSDSWLWVLDTAWVVYPANPNDPSEMAAYQNQRLTYCDADYVENGTGQPLLAPPPPSESLACKEGPARIMLMEIKPVAEDVQPAPYRVVGTLGNPPFHYTYYHLDHLGSPRILTNKDGVRVQGQHFLPFGQEMPIEAGLNTRKFTGHERDPETGLDYMLARYYQANLGRFMAVDPAAHSIKHENPQTWNRYTYVANNPVVFTDPTGEKIGDRFATPEKAGRDAVAEINPTSIAENREYGGTVEREVTTVTDPKGKTTETVKYFATEAKPGDGDSFSPSIDPVTTVGDYHTHGDYSTAGKDGNPSRVDPKLPQSDRAAKDQYGSDDFSPADKRGIAGDAQKTSPERSKHGESYKGYLGTPSGKIKEYEPPK